MERVKWNKRSFVETNGDLSKVALAREITMENKFEMIPGLVHLPNQIGFGVITPCDAIKVLPKHQRSLGAKTVHQRQGHRVVRDLDQPFIFLGNEIQIPHRSTRDSAAASRDRYFSA